MRRSFSSKIVRCASFQERVDDLVGRDLAPELTTAMATHARSCLACARSWKAAEERAVALRSLAPEALEATGVRPAGKKDGKEATADAVFARLTAGEGASLWAEKQWVGKQWVQKNWRRAAAAAVLLASAGIGALATRHEMGGRAGGALDVRRIAESGPPAIPVTWSQGRELQRVDGPNPIYYRWPGPRDFDPRDQGDESVLRGTDSGPQSGTEIASIRRRF
jgi:hypothetical protein